MATRGQHYHIVDDAGGRRAAVRVGDAAGRDDVNVNADGLRVVAFVAYLDDEVPCVGLAIAQNDAARG